jgi:stress response protein YsnF
MGKAVNEKQAVLSKHNHSTIDLRYEIDSLHRVVKFARETLEKSLTGSEGSSMGYKKLMLSRDDAASIQALATALEKLVNMKMKYDKHLKDKADELSPEEEDVALIEFFAGKEVPQRRKMLRKMVNRHNALIEGSAAKEVTISIANSILGEDNGV